MKKENENQLHTEQKVSSDSNNMAILEINLGNQSQDRPASSQIFTQNPNSGDVSGDQAAVKVPSNTSDIRQKATNMLETNLENMPTDQRMRPRFGRKRLLSQSNDESQMLLQDASVIQSFDSQASQPLPSQLDGSCQTCKEYKVEIKRLKHTNKRLINDAEAAKKRMDNNMAIVLKGQETMQKELILLRRNNEKQHVELTAVKALMRDIQSAVGRYKF